MKKYYLILSLILSLSLFEEAKALTKPEIVVDTVWMRQTWDVLSISFHPSSQFLAVGNSGAYVGIWDVKTGTEIKKYEGEIGGNVFFSKTGKYLLQGNTTGFKIRDFSTDTVVFSWFGNDEYSSFSVVISDDEKYVANGGRNFIKIWEIQTGKLIKYFDTSIFKPDAPNKDHFDILQLDFSPDGSHLTFPIIIDDTSQVQELIFLNLTDYIVDYKCSIGSFSKLKYSHDGTKIAFSSSDSGEAIKIMDVNTKQIVATIPGYPQGVGKIVFSFEDKYLVYTYADQIIVWNIFQNKAIKIFYTIPPGYWFSSSCDISFDEKYIVGASGGYLFLFNFNDKTNINEENTIKANLLYPNPASQNLINLNFELIKPNQTEINIYNINGQIVQKVEGKFLTEGSQSYSIDISNLYNGTYFLKINSGIYYFSQSFIINK